MFELQSSSGQTLEVTPDAAEVGQLHDARAWGDFPYLYLSVVKKSPWFEGAKPLEAGTTWEINFTLRLPPADTSVGAEQGPTGEDPTHAMRPARAPAPAAVLR